MNELTEKLRPIWLSEDGEVVKIIDQRLLPHEFVVVDLRTVYDVIAAIKAMYVRGAPLIGVTAAYGMYLAVKSRTTRPLSDDYITGEGEKIKAARPTAVNLAWAVDRMAKAILKESKREDRIEAARKESVAIDAEEVNNCCKIGEYGLRIIRDIASRDVNRPVNILTHCNAGWLACVEYGTATAPIYAAHERGIDVHVWVDETRPLNQGARLTAWELEKNGIRHTVITDNAGGHLMQKNMVDLVLVGTDRTTYTGDVANKIGTYLKALAAKDNNVPFYVALPSSTFDWNFRNGVREIPIEERDPEEVRYVYGYEESLKKGINVLVVNSKSPAANYAFDVTPARLVTGFITERGICRAEEKDILRLFPEKVKSKK